MSAIFQPSWGSNIRGRVISLAQPRYFQLLMGFQHRSIVEHPDKGIVLPTPQRIPTPDVNLEGNGWYVLFQPLMGLQHCPGQAKPAASNASSNPSWGSNTFRQAEAVAVKPFFQPLKGFQHNFVAKRVANTAHLPTPHGVPTPWARAWAAIRQTSSNPSWGSNTSGPTAQKPKPLNFQPLMGFQHPCSRSRCRRRPWTSNPSWGSNTLVFGMTRASTGIFQPLMGFQHTSDNAGNVVKGRLPTPYGVPTLSASRPENSIFALPTPYGVPTPTNRVAELPSWSNFQPLMGFQHGDGIADSRILRRLPTPHGVPTHPGGPQQRLEFQASNPSWGSNTLPTLTFSKKPATDCAAFSQNIALSYFDLQGFLQDRRPKYVASDRNLELLRQCISIG